MAGRSPSFVVVGLLLIVFLVGFFYMSCSSKSTELRQTLDEFEQRIRMLTLKNSDIEREVQVIKTQKNEADRKMVDTESEMKKKDSKLNDLNTKLNEKLAELQSLKSDKQVVDEQLKELKNEAGPLSSKNLAMNKLQEEYDKQKKSDNELIVRLKQEVEDYRSQFNISKEKPIEIPSQRFQPLFQAKEIAKNTSAIFREPLAKLSNITNEIRDKFAPVVSNIKQKIANIYGNESNSVVNQNIPAPPLNNNKQQPGRESGAEVDKNNQEQNKIENLQRLKRSLNDTNKSSFNKSNGDQQNSDIHNVARDIERARNAPYDKANLANNQPDNVPSQLLGIRKNYRVGDREESPRIANKKDGNQVIANNNGQEQAL
ncbi:unnamed protein product, partial [Adineta steineri]